jgi:diguanylate cyclase (GGDEF)-like protein
MALLLMDLDRFKAVNDTLGHEVGDELLKEVSARFKANIRESDTVSRTGGDEFTFVVADINKAEDAADVAQKIVASLQKPFFISGHELRITTSVGISIYPDDGEETDTLIRYADIAMYYAKEQGRNTFQFYNSAINIRSVERIRLESMLRQTVERGELAVYYQPQIDINSRKIICSEALVRWNHPELGLLESKRFMEMAEETGYITVIDEWVLRTVCAQVRRWLDAGLGPREFQNPRLVQMIANILKEAGTPPEYVDIEITESLAMSNITRTVYRLKELAEMGVRALIDDFGTGYSSLSQLKRLPIQKLKIDQSFIKDIATDPDDRAIINAVTSMAHSMSMRVIAEGVETDDQLSFLRATHCDEAQGFLFSRALPPYEFEHTFLTKKAA